MSGVRVNSRAELTAAFGDVLEQVVKSLVGDALDVGAAKAPKLVQQRAGNETTRAKDGVEVRPLVAVKLDFDAVGCIDAVVLALPFLAFAQPMKDTPQLLPRMFESSGRIREEKRINGER